MSSFVCFLHLPSDNGQTAGRSHPAASRLQGDVFRGRPLLDVQDSHSSLPDRCYHIPGLPARHSPRSPFRPPGFTGRFLRDPPSVCVHLDHVQRSGHTETERLGANL